MTYKEMARHNEVYKDWQDCVEFIRLFLKRFGEDVDPPGFMEKEEMLDRAFRLVQKARIDEMKDETLDTL